jgi:hypothetical protein
MKKLMAATILLILPMLLAGCVAANLTYSLNTEGTANVFWKLEATTSGEKQSTLVSSGMDFARSQFATLASQWKSQGFDASTSEADNSVAVTGQLSSQGSRELSFQQLESWMQSETLSPFSTVKSNHQVSATAEEYLLDATVDWKDIVNSAELSAAPVDLRSNAQLVMKNSKITVSITLPGKAVDSEGTLVENNGLATCTVTATPDKPVRIMLHTRIEQAYKPKTIASAGNFRQWSFVAACALSGLFLLILASRIVVKMRKSREY